MSLCRESVLLLSLVFQLFIWATSGAQNLGCTLSSLTPQASLHNAVISVIEGIGDGRRRPDSLTVYDQHVVCLVTALERDEYRYASVVVLFSCSGRLGFGSPLGSECAPGKYTAQFDLECRGDSNYSSWQSSQTPFQFGSGSSLVFFNPPDANFSTGLDSYCSLCVDPNRVILHPESGVPIPIDPVTHCAACADSCLKSTEGQGLCHGVHPSTCCNFFEDNLCVEGCSSGRKPQLENDQRTLVCVDSVQPTPTSNITSNITSNFDSVQLTPTSNITSNITSNSGPDTSCSTSIALSAILSFVIAFLLGVASGAVAVHYTKVKGCRLCCVSGSNDPPLGHEYDTVDSPTQVNMEDIELRRNTAYNFVQTHRSDSPHN